MNNKSKGVEFLMIVTTADTTKDELNKVILLHFGDTILV